MKKTKIVATLGPASESEKNIEKMIKAGMNVVRLNFSHGEHNWHKMAIDRVRKVSKRLNVNVGILADLQGPRIRTLVESDVQAKKGEVVYVYEMGTKVNNPKGKFIFIDKGKIIQDLHKNQEILIEDGLIKLKVIENKKIFLETKVIDPGVIKNHKGMNIPGADLDIAVITSKDKRDLDFALENDVDFIALSFVKSGENIRNLRKMIKRKIKNKDEVPQIISKIERQEAISNLDDILKETDAIMVARGDLGIEMDESRVVILQKEIISRSIRHLRPVIVATQMLGSMVENPRPTRAEVSDVSNAVIDHADAVMLSGESATGNYPVESVATMAKIIEKTEESAYDDVFESLPCDICSEFRLVIKSACELARSFKAQAICMISISGYTARLVSHFRPDQKILVATNNEKTFRQFSLSWGVEGFVFKKSDDMETLIDKMIKEAKNNKSLKRGDNIVIIMGRTLDGEKMRLVGVKKIG